MVTKEAAPSLLRVGISWSPWHRSGDRTLRAVEPQHEHLAVNARCSPRRVLGSHPADHGADLGLRAGASDAPATRRPGPVPPKTLSMPTHDRVGLDDDEDRIGGKI